MSESYVTDFSVLLSVFVGQKITAHESITFTDHASRIRLSDCSRLAINRKNDNDVTIWWHDVIIIFLTLLCFSFVKFIYWSKFHVNIMTGSGVTTIFVYKGLNRNSKIGNTPIWVLPNIWRLGWVRDTKFCTNVSNKRLLNAAKC